MAIAKKLVWLWTVCTGFNPNSLGRFRTKAENPDSRTCYFTVADEDHIYNVFISKHKNKDADNNEIYFEIEGIKSQTSNKTFNNESKLDKLSENGRATAGTSQFGFGIYNAGDAKFVRKSRFKPARKSARLNFPLGR